MQNLPHHYRVTASGGPEDGLSMSSEGLPRLAVAAPVEFDGPGDRWSPETLLSGAVASCFILTFRALADRAGFAWDGLDVITDGVLDKSADGLRFKSFRISACIELPEGSDRKEAERLLNQAEKHCLISRSLEGEVEVELQCESVAA